MNIDYQRSHRRRRILMLSALYAMSVATYIFLIRPRRRRQGTWVSPYVRQRGAHGAMANQFRALFNEDDHTFKDFMRLTKTEFHELLGLIEDDIDSSGSTSREGISPKQKLIVTLRYLAAGATQKSLSLYFMLGRPTITHLIPKVLKAIIQRLRPSEGRVPTTEEQWLEVARGFKEKWDFPNCLGAIDGKHVNMIKPPNSGSLYYDYKGNYSISLMAIVSADYRFLHYDIGRPGRMSDAGIWSRDPLKAKMEESTNPLNIPPDTTLDGLPEPLPYYLVGDDAFGLTSRLMKPYPGTDLSRNEIIFNYRLSRARHIVEAAFGHLANRFRILLNRLNIIPRNAMLVVEACVLLHNWLLTKRGPYEFAQPWGDANLADLPGRRPFPERLNPANPSPTAIRSNLANYFADVFTVPYQWES